MSSSNIDESFNEWAHKNNYDPNYKPLYEAYMAGVEFIIDTELHELRQENHELSQKNHEYWMLFGQL